MKSPSCIISKITSKKKMGCIYSQINNKQPEYSQECIHQIARDENGCIISVIYKYKRSYNEYKLFRGYPLALLEKMGNSDIITPKDIYTLYIKCDDFTKEIIDQFLKANLAVKYITNEYQYPAHMFLEYSVEKSKESIIGDSYLLLFNCLAARDKIAYQIIKHDQQIAMQKLRERLNLHTSTKDGCIEEQQSN